MIIISFQPRKLSGGAVDLTTIDGVVSHMAGANTPEEWNERCDEVKEANGGSFPRFWKREILDVGVGIRFWGRPKS
jgi:hypothetical protein